MSNLRMLFTMLGDIAEASENTIDTVKLITIIAIALLAVVMVIISSKKTKLDTRSMVYAAICIAASFSLSFIKIPFPFGGSITLASFVPIIIYSYVYGPAKGLITGIIYGLLQFIQESWFLTPVQFVLDYILAFSSIALAGSFKRVLNGKSAVILGTAAVGTVRLIMHILAGIMFFNAGYIYEGLPVSSPLLYSSVYNIIYVAPDIIIALAVIIYMLYSGLFDRLKNIMMPSK